MSGWRTMNLLACGAALFSALLLSELAYAEDVDQGPNGLRYLPRACEVDLALSAAPEHLRERATVYVLESEGYAQVQEGSNGFTCIVNRDHPRVLKPTCFDAEGSETIVPKIRFFGDGLVAGRSVESIRAAVTSRFDDATFISPRRPGVAYMLSRYNRPYNPSTDQLGWFPPHVMFYAPDLTGDDIGFDMQAWHANGQLPFIGYQGPHGYMIVITDDGTERTRDDLRGCPGWVHADAAASAADEAPTRR